MTIRTLFNRKNIWRNVYLLLRHAPRRGEWFSNFFMRAVSVVVLIPFIIMWWQPFTLPFAVAILVLLMGVTVWWQWLGREHFFLWLAAGTTLILYWGSSFLFWIFLESVLYRLLWLIILLLFSWWYLSEWHKMRHKLFVGEQLLVIGPTLALNFLIVFCLGVSAESLLVFLDYPLWLLLLAFYLPIVISFIALAKINNWSPLVQWRYWLTAAILLSQIFILLMWWPTSFYVIGFVLATSYLAIVLVLRQESQGFLNIRSFGRELAIIILTLIVVLIFARWI